MRRAALLAGLAVALASCSGNEGRSVTLLAHDFFYVDPSVLDEFTLETGIEVEVILGGDAGLLVSQAMLASGNPVGDVLFGVDNTLLTRALDSDIFIPYTSPASSSVPDELAGGPMVTAIDFGDVCVNYDRSFFGGDPPAPRSLRDVADPAYRGLLVVEDPTLSSPGLAFLLATVEAFGEDGDYTWRDFWADLRANDVAIAPDWGTAYYGMFSGASDGDRPLVVSYATSPGAELLAESPPPEPGTAVMTEGCFRQIEYAGILRGTDDRRAAELLIDFLLDPRVQAGVPGWMFVYPARADVPLPDWLDPAPDTAPLDRDLIDRNRARWLAEWSETALG